MTSTCSIIIRTLPQSNRLNTSLGNICSTLKNPLTNKLCIHGWYQTLDVKLNPFSLSCLTSIMSSIHPRRCETDISSNSTIHRTLPLSNAESAFLPHSLTSNHALYAACLLFYWIAHHSKLLWVTKELERLRIRMLQNHGNLKLQANSVCNSRGWQMNSILASVRVKRNAENGTAL